VPWKQSAQGASPPAAASSRLVVGSDSDGRLLLPAERALAEDRRMLRRSGAPALPVLRVAVAARGASTFGGPLLAACGGGSGLASSAACRLMTLSRRGPCLNCDPASYIPHPPLVFVTQQTTAGRSLAQ